MGIFHNIHIHVTFNLYLKLCKIPRQVLHSQERGICTSQENTGSNGQAIHLSAVSTGSPFYLIKSASEGLPRFSLPMYIFPTTLSLFFLSLLFPGSQCSMYLSLHVVSATESGSSHPTVGTGSGLSEWSTSETMFSHQYWSHLMAQMQYVNAAAVDGRGIPSGKVRMGRNEQNETSKEHSLLPYLIL